MTNEAINLVNLMSQFYQLIANVKVWIREGQLGKEVMSMLKLENLPSDEEMASAISLLLYQWIAKTQLHYKDTLTTRELWMLDRACFAMASLADELLIMELEWPGREHWHEVLLEDQIYQSCSAGEVLFTHIDELLADGNYDPLECDLAALYLLTLRLGFSGRHRDDEQSLEIYRKKLFYIVNRGQKENNDKISDEAYRQRLVSEQEQRLAPLSKWYQTMIYGGIGYIVTGIVLYYSVTWSLNQWMGG